MGVDCKITLPAAARLRDVADVLGALAGLPMVKWNFSNTEGYSAHCEGVKYSRYDLPGLEECCKIEFDAPLTGPVQQMYHFEFGADGARGITPRARSVWIAIGRGLVDFFGGSVDYNDCDDEEMDYSQPQRDDIHAEDGEEWYALQDRKLAVKPITKSQVDKCKTVAAYG